MITVTFQDLGLLFLTLKGFFRRSSFSILGLLKFLHKHFLRYRRPFSRLRAWHFLGPLKFLRSSTFLYSHFYHFRPTIFLNRDKRKNQGNHSNSIHSLYSFTNSLIYIYNPLTKKVTEFIKGEWELEWLP